jgi:TnpA family transposase
VQRDTVHARRASTPQLGVGSNTKLILSEEDNIKHILASLAKKVTSQSVIIGKLSSYARKNRTKKALWELDNLHRRVLP